MFNHFTWTIIRVLYDPTDSGYIDAYMIWKWQRLWNAWVTGGGLT